MDLYPLQSRVWTCSGGVGIHRQGTGSWKETWKEMHDDLGFHRGCEKVTTTTGLKRPDFLPVPAIRTCNEGQFLQGLRGGSVLTAVLLLEAVVFLGWCHAFFRASSSLLSPFSGLCSLALGASCLPLTPTPWRPRAGQILWPQPPAIPRESLGPGWGVKPGTLAKVGAQGSEQITLSPTPASVAGTERLGLARGITEAELRGHVVGMAGV